MDEFGSEDTGVEPRSPSVLQVLRLRAPSCDASGCNTASYEFIFLVRNEEAGGSNPFSSTRNHECLCGFLNGQEKRDARRSHSDPSWSKNSNGLRWHNLRFPRFSSNRFAKAPIAYNPPSTTRSMRSERVQNDLGATAGLRYQERSTKNFCYGTSIWRRRTAS